MNNINSNTFRIKKETMTLIADRLRVLVGKTSPLTPAEIAYYLERVIFTPQSYANSEFQINLDSDTIGILPEIKLGSANSEFELAFESSISAILPEYEIGKAISEFLLNFESSAIETLQEE